MCEAPNQCFLVECVDVRISRNILISLVWGIVKVLGDQPQGTNLFLKGLLRTLPDSKWIDQF